MEMNSKTSNCGSHENCSISSCNSSVSQTLDEMDFERGIWHAAQTGDLPRVEYLIETKGVSPNARDLSGYVALHYASRGGHVDVCKRLIEAGADVNLTTRAGKATPLHRAASCGKTAIIQLLLGKKQGIPCKSDVSARDADGNTALHKAVLGGHEHAVRLLIEASPELVMIPNNKGFLPRYYANTPNMIKLLEEESTG